MSVLTAQKNVGDYFYYYYCFTVLSTEGLQQHVLQP